jgi:hypothetical protein
VAVAALARLPFIKCQMLVCATRTCGGFARKVCKVSRSKAFFT